MVDTKRYWDGSAWSDKVAPLSSERTEPSADERVHWAVEVIGWIGVLAFPLLGSVVGVYMAANRHPRGIWMTLLALTIGCIYIFNFVNSGPETTFRY
jgi:hypothetical protein